MHPRGNALHEKLRAARKGSDEKLLKEAFEDICGVLQEPEIFQPKSLPYGTPSCLSALVTCSECALKLGEIDIAEDCNNKYFEHCNQYVLKSGENFVEPIVIEDQWKIRALYVAGRLQYEKNKQEKGQRLRDVVLSALQNIVDGISAARKSKRYNFLVYNGSVHFWKIGRSLMKEGIRALLQPLGKVVIDALAYLPQGQEDWKANCLINYALCLQEVGKLDEAIQRVTEAYQCIEKSTNKDLVSLALGLKTHLLQKAGKLSDKDRKTGEEESEVLILLQAIRTSKLSAQDAEKPLNELVEKVKNSELEANNDIMADIGWVAYTHSAIAIAESCALVAKESAKDPLARLRADLTLQALEFLQAEDDDLTYRKNIEAISKFDETLSSLIRIGDASAIQDCCVLIWNTSLVLQKLTTRKFIMHPFSNAVSILDKMESPLIKLRVQFHLEITKGSLENNFLSNAAKHADKGFYLYETFMNQNQDPNARQSTLAKTMTELKKVVDMKSKKSFEVIEPTTVDKQIDYNKLEDCVIQAVENALNAKTQSEKEEILSRAIILVDNVRHQEMESNRIQGEPTEESEDAAPEEPVQEEQQKEREWKPEEITALEKQVILWNHIVQSAWVAKLDRIVRQAATHVFPEFSFDKVEHSEAIKVQIDASYADAQSCVFTLESKGLKLDPPTDTEAVDPDLGRPPEEIATDDDLIVRACSQFIRGVKLSILLEDYTLALNGAIYIWNAFSVYIDQNSGEEYDKTVCVMKVLLKHLLKISSDKQDRELLCKLCNTLACGLEHQVLINWSKNSKSYQVLLIELAKHKTIDLSEGDSKLVEEALESCESVISMLAEECDSVLFATCARLVRLAGKSPTVKSGQMFESARENISYVVHVIEQVQNEILVGKLRKEALRDAIKAVKKLEKPFYDLLIQIARASLEKYESHAAMESSAECLKMLGLEEGENPSFKHTDKTKYEWYIASACEMIAGEASLQVRQLDKQERSVQLHIYKIARKKLLKAAKYAYYANHQKMVLRAGRLFWNSVLTLMNNAEERNSIIENLEEMFSYIDSSAIYAADRTLCVLIVRALLEAYTEEESWDQGLKRLTAAFRILPQNEHLSLWKKRTYLLIKAGLNPMNDDVKDHSEDIKAELWLIVARNSYNREDRYSAYSNACECFPQNPVKSAKCFLTLADWLMEENLPQDDIVHVLNKAATLLLKIKNVGTGSEAKSLCHSGEPDMFLEGCSIYQVSTLLHFFILKMQLGANFEERHFMAHCAAICCKYLMLNGFHASCLAGGSNQSESTTFPCKWSEWVDMLVGSGPRDWIICIEDELSHGNYYLYKDLICLAEALFEMKDYGYCLQVSWLLILFEETPTLHNKCEELGYIYASKTLQATGMFEVVTKIEERIDTKVMSLQKLNLTEANLHVQKCSPILSFLGYVEHFMSRGLKSRAAKLLMFVNDNFNIAASATAVKLKFYLLASEIELSFNRYESALMNLSQISHLSKVKGGLGFWKKYISLYVDVKLGLGHVSQYIHQELDNVKSIFEMILSKRSNTIASYEFQETLSYLYQRDAELHFLEAAEMERSGWGEKAKHKLLEAFAMLDLASQQLKKTGSPSHIDVNVTHVRHLWKKAREERSKEAFQLIIDLLTDAEKNCIGNLNCKLTHKDAKDINGVHTRANGFQPYLRKLGEVRYLLGTAQLEFKVLMEKYNDGMRENLPSFPKVDGKDAACVEEYLSHNAANQNRNVMATNELSGILADDSYSLCAEVNKFSALGLNLTGLSLADQGKTLQAISALQKSFKLSIEESNIDTALSTAESLMGLFLQIGDIRNASVQLFIIQSCKFSLRVPEIVANAASATDKGRVLLQSRKKMMEELLLPRKSEIYKSVNHKLESMNEVLSHMSMQMQVESVTKNLPEETLFVSFHIGKGIDDPFQEEHVYVACMKKCNDNEDGIEAHVDKIVYVKEDWKKLSDRISLWKSKSSKFLKDHHALVDQEMQKQKAGEDGSGSDNEAAAESTIPKSFLINSKELLVDGWNEILGDARELLEPLMTTVRNALGIKPEESKEKSSEDGAETEGEEGAVAEIDTTPQEISTNICLCADASLSFVPYEAMDEFRQCLSVTRNPCLVSFCLLNQQLEASTPSGKAHVCTKDFNKLKFIVDPRGQFVQKEKEDDATDVDVCKFFEDSLQKQFKDWDGIIGRESLNVGESYIEHVYDNSSSLMCITPGPFSKIFSSQSIIHTNLKSCRMGFIFDQCIGGDSFLEEKQLIQKSELEDHYDLSTLLMLQGVKTVVVNSMTTTNLACTKMIQSFIEAMNGGSGIAKAVKEARSCLQGLSEVPPHLPFTPVVYGLNQLTIKG